MASSDLPSERRQVAVIGAGPSGSIAAALLRRRGHDVLVIERQRFPRFSIGESLLAHCLDFVEEAGMMPAVEAAGFQLKNGAAFGWGERYTDFNFGDNFTPGRGTTFQVERAKFDKVLADEATAQGVEIRYEHGLEAIEFQDGRPLLTVHDEHGVAYRVEAEFVLDASGYGRVLPRLLDLELPSTFPVRKAVFTHIEDGIVDPQFDRNKILITTHPTQRDIWYWLIPFSNGRCSMGVVAAEGHFAGR
ncbi:MAG: NAD(P)/FAD-dependent oxidoreductase, partial [Spongiibacteraceae bacterium]|nr:NAD(P)/FAD-dependent oxidoreductase [Spongiibacteraceae bacterium]